MKTTIKMLSIVAMFLFAAVFTSCNNEAVMNDVDGALPETKALPGAYTVKTVDVTVGVNTRQYRLVHDADGLLDSVYITAAGQTYAAWVDRSVVGKLIVRCDDPNQGEVMRYSYTLGVASLISAEEAYDSDGYLLGKMQFTKDASQRLTAIKVGEEDANENWSFSDVATFSYKRGNNYNAMTEEGTPVNLDYGNEYKNLASIDLNLWCLFGAGSAYGEILNFAILADLLPNVPNLVSQARVDDNNKVDFVYTMSGDKALSCAINATSQITDEDTGETAIVTQTTNVTFGY